MANTIMASSKTLITSSLPSTPKPHNLPHIPTLKVPKLKQPNFQKLLTLTSTTSSVAAAILAMAPPSIAAEIEKAALFDFNLTLPIIMAEFLILMVSLDKIYYSPLGKFMDDRDAEIKEKLNSVKDTTAEVKQMEDQADAIMKAARAEIAAALSKMKKEMTAETEEKLAEGKKKITVEIGEAMVKLEAQKEETLKALDSQIAALSDDIVRKVIPL